jgi:hypothetical protein
MSAADVRFASKATELLHRRRMTRWGDLLSYTVQSVLQLDAALHAVN